MSEELKLVESSQEDQSALTTEAVTDKTVTPAEGWREKKLNGSKKEQQAAVSQQVGRIAAKLLERSRGWQDSDAHFPNNVAANLTKFDGAKDGDESASLTHSREFYDDQDVNTLKISSRQNTSKSLFGKEKTEKTVKISSSELNKTGGSGKKYSTELTIDPEGKKKPTLDSSISYYKNGYKTAYPDKTKKLSAKELVSEAAPALYDLKKGIDRAETHGWGGKKAA